MKKIKLDLNSKGETSFEFCGDQIVVRGLTIQEQAELINEYLDSYFFTPEDKRLIGITERNRFAADIAMKLAIIDKCTNIAVMDEDGEQLINIDAIVSSGLWGALEEHIPNYYDFEIMLLGIVSDIREELALTKSVGGVLNNLIESISRAIDNLSQADMSPEGLAKVESIVREFGDTLRNSGLAGSLVQEAQK